MALILRIGGAITSLLVVHAAVSAEIGEHGRVESLFLDEQLVAYLVVAPRKLTAHYDISICSKWEVADGSSLTYILTMGEGANYLLNIQVPLFKEAFPDNLHTPTGFERIDFSVHTSQLLNMTLEASIVRPENSTRSLQTKFETIELENILEHGEVLRIDGREVASGYLIDCPDVAANAPDAHQRTMGSSQTERR